MSTVFTLSLVLLGAAAFLVLGRLVLGPSTADRVVAVDTLLMVLVAALGVLTAATKEPRYIVLIVIVSLLGFVATTAAARYLELADPDEHREPQRERS